MTPDELIEAALTGGSDDTSPWPQGPSTEAEIALFDRRDGLRRAIDHLLDDGEDPEPPPDLAERTLAFVAAHRNRRGLADLAPVSVPFRWVDLAVAASIFLAGLATLVPAARRAQVQSGQVSCSLNLAQLGRGLAHYAMNHGSYPYPDRACPAPYAALYKVMLNDAGELDDAALLNCPSSGHARPHQAIPSYSNFCAMRTTDPRAFAQILDGDYAYQLGYRHPSGRATHPEPLASHVALLSDRPAFDDQGRILEGNSPNHGGIGQNVLFSDGHVGWYLGRAVGPHDPDMFLNKSRRPEPGIDPSDAVLAPGAIPFFR